MTTASHRHARAIGIAPSSNGFGFAVLEGGVRLLDWGWARLHSNQDEELLVRVQALVQRYGPTSIALEDVSGTRKGARAARRIDAITRVAKQRHIECDLVPRIQIRHATGLSDKVSKYEVAQAIMTTFQELETLLPPPKEAWQSEDKRMSVFDAIALLVGATG